MECEVCDGEGTYAIIDRNGWVHSWIRCPGCFGSGEADEEAIAATEAERKADIQRAKYEAAMAEKRASRGKAG